MDIKIPRANSRKSAKRISRKTLFQILGIEIAILVILVSMAFFSTSGQVIKDCLNGIKGLRIASFFESDLSTLPGISPDDIETKLKDEGMSCQSLGEDDEGRYHLKCSKSTKKLIIETLVLGRNDESVDLIDININQSEQPSDDEAALYLCEISSLVLDDSGTDSSCNWIKQTLPEIRDANDVHKNSFSGVRHILYGAPEARSLEIGRLQ